VIDLRASPVVPWNRAKPIGLPASTVGAAPIERVAAISPWPLFLFCWPMIFLLFNDLTSPSRSYSDQELLSSVVDNVETGASILARVFVVVLGIVGATLLVRYRSRIKLSPAIASLALALFTWSAMTVAWSTDPALSLRHIVYLALMTLFAAGCAARMNTFSLSVYLVSIPGIALVPGILAEMYYGTFRPFSSGYRFSGCAVHPNVEAATLAVATGTLCWLSWRTRGVQRCRFALASLFVGGFLVLTGSRTSLVATLIGLAVSFALLLARDYPRLLRTAAVYFCLIGTFGALVYLSSSSGTLSSAITRSNDDSDATSLNGRVYLWKTLLGYAAERPWGGYGYGSFWTPQRIEDVSKEEGWAIQQAHSAYLEQLLTLGIPGLTLYVALLCACLFRCVAHFWWHRDGYGAWVPILVVIMVHNLTEGTNVNPSATNLVFLLIVAHLGIVRPDPPSLTANSSDLFAESRGVRGVECQYG